MWRLLQCGSSSSSGSGLDRWKKTRSKNGNNIRFNMQDKTWIKHSTRSASCIRDCTTSRSSAACCSGRSIVSAAAGRLSFNYSSCVGGLSNSQVHQSSSQDSASLISLEDLKPARLSRRMSLAQRRTSHATHFLPSCSLGISSTCTRRRCCCDLLSLRYRLGLAPPHLHTICRPLRRM